MVNSIKDLARSFKEAQVALEVGKVFDTEKPIVSYNHLGIARLIYQLPTTLCEMFLKEVFRKGSIDALDHETLFPETVRSPEHLGLPFGKNQEDHRFGSAGV